MEGSQTGGQGWNTREAGSQASTEEKRAPDTKRSSWFVSYQYPESAVIVEMAKARLSPPTQQSPCRTLGHSAARPRRHSRISPSLPSSGSTWSGPPGSSYLRFEGEEPGKRSALMGKCQEEQGSSLTREGSPQLQQFRGDPFRSVHRPLSLISHKPSNAVSAQ